jgi:hypothetical protein
VTHPRIKSVAALGIALALVAATSGCDRCTNAPVATVPSPSGKNKAVVFHRTCGVDTQVNTQVAVIPSYSSLSNIPGNALILTGDVPLDVRWTSEDTVSISGMGTARASRQEESVAGITIEYATPAQ